MFTIDTASTRTIQVDTFVIPLAAPIMALARDEFDLGEELLLAVEGCLRRSLLVLLKLVHFYGASSGAGRFKRASTILCQVLPEVMVLRLGLPSCTLVVILTASDGCSVDSVSTAALPNVTLTVRLVASSLS